MKPYARKLKFEREQRAWSQEQVAAMLETTAPNVSRWERGITFPSLHFRQKLCEIFGKSLNELGLNVPEEEVPQPEEDVSATVASVEKEPFLWRLPYHRNPLFTARERELQKLHEGFQLHRRAVIAIQGMPGIGKTQLGVEYAYRYSSEYSAIFWIGAESAETVHSSILAIAETLRLPEREETNQQQIVAAVQHWLKTHKQWLLIWDNLEDMEIFQHFLPTAYQGASLITTRRQALGPLVQNQELPLLQQEEGILLLLRRAKLVGTEATGPALVEFATGQQKEYKAAQDLVQMLGNLPLALDQAGAYIEETACSVASYLKRYVQEQDSLLARRGGTIGDHPESVAATFRLSCQQLEQEQAEAARILKLSAFLYAERLPEEIFVTGSTQAEAGQEAIVPDTYHLDQACAALRNFSLVQRHTETQTLTIHRLIQIVLREGMSEQEQKRWQRQAIHLLNTLFPQVTHDTWSLCERFLTHALACTAMTPEQADELEDQACAELLQKAADYLHERARYEQAEPLFQRALHIFERVAGESHPAVARLLNMLALLYLDQGKHLQAEALFQRTIHILTQMEGTEQANVAQPLTNLATLYFEQGKYEQAETLYRSALQTWEKAWGPDHPGLEHPLYGLANLLRERGKYEQAESLFLQALRIIERTLGKRHPHVGHPLNGLALLFLESGKYEQAEPLFQQVLHIWEKVLGPEHPRIAEPLTNLAQLALEQERFEEAERLCQRALDIAEGALGETHPDLAEPLNTRAKIYLKQGEDEQAKSLFTRTLQIRETAFGPEHPLVAFPLAGLAAISQKQGDHMEAELLYRRALNMRKRRLDPFHPEIARCLTGLAALYEKQGRLEQAEALQQRAHSIFEQRLGPAHRETFEARNASHRLRERIMILEKQATRVEKKC